MGTKQVICDTDVMIDFFDVAGKRHTETKRIIENEIGLENVVISAITRMELLNGAANKSEETKLKKKLQRFNVALIDNEISTEALLLFDLYRLSHNLEIPDCFIAATAKIMNVKLFTYNVKDYRFIHSLTLLTG